MGEDTAEAAISWLETLHLSWWQALMYLGIVLVTWRLPAIFKHRQEMTAIRNDFSLKSARNLERIEKEKDKRARKRLKGESK